MSEYWILIADSGRARLFSCEKPQRGHWQELRDWLNPAARVSEGRTYTDHAGRTGDAHSGARHAFEGRALTEHNITPFARELADDLRDGVLNAAFKHLIIAAAPQFLGELRKHLDKAVQQRIVLSIDRDLTQLAQPELEAHLLPLLSGGSRPARTGHTTPVR